MPALEAMACGLPVIVTAGGPTDEFVPDEACWRIPSARRARARAIASTMAHRRPPVHAGAGLPTPWRTCCWRGRGRRGARGRAAGPAARPLRRIRLDGGRAERYAERDPRAGRAARRARARPRGAAVRARPGRPGARLLATPAWLGEDRLGELLARLGGGDQRQATPACLYLLADPRVDGDEAACTERVLRPRRQPAPTSTGRGHHDRPPAAARRHGGADPPRRHRLCRRARRVRGARAVRAARRQPGRGAGDGRDRAVGRRGRLTRRVTVTPSATNRHGTPDRRCLVSGTVPDTVPDTIQNRPG